MDWKQEVFKRLDALAEKLGVAAQHLWAILVRQAYVEAATYAVFMVLTAIGCYLLYRWTRNYFKRNKEFFDGQPGEGMPMIFCWIIGVVAVCFSMYGLLQLPQLLINPEYYALQKVLEVLK